MDSVGRRKKLEEKKAISISISLLPKHIEMLESLEKNLGKKRSYVIQYLISKQHFNIKG